MIEYRTFGPERIDEVRAVYEENGWREYLTDKEKLRAAFSRSLYVLGAFSDGELAGFVRCVGDGEYVVHVQDLIVRPRDRRKGIGRELMKRASEAFPDVRQFVLITDRDDAVSNTFYHAIGMTEDLGPYPVNHWFRPLPKEE